jgi:hypothetical protein
MLTAASGFGTFTSSDNNWVLPAGIADIFIDVESSSDLDFELFDGSTTIVGAGGLLSSNSSDFTLQLSGAASGNIRYWWGYYDSVRTGGVTKSALNQIISRSYIDCVVVYSGVLGCSQS